jgi:hypothetical protein
MIVSSLVVAKKARAHFGSVKSPLGSATPGCANRFHTSPNSRDSAIFSREQSLFAHARAMCAAAPAIRGRIA